MVLRAILCLLLLVLPARAAERDVDLELILAVDVSRSMDSDEQKLQRDGYVAAFRHADVVDAIMSGLHGRIAVTYIEWAGPTMQKIVQPWTVIDSAAAANQFADTLAAAPISYYHGTSISSGLLFAAPAFAANDFTSPRQVIDISGDGPNNMGSPAPGARDQLVQAGITINGLPIMLKRPSGFASIEHLDIYYEDCVIGGHGAFIVPVQDIGKIAQAIRRKLVLEIAGRPPVFISAAAASRPPRIDCQIGERQRQRWMDP
ncbi:DUF1194 domain-containing protein [soil metagenome]